MAWGVYFTAVAEEWIVGLSEDDYLAMLAAIELLEELPTTSRARGTTT